MSGAILPIYRWLIEYNGSPAAGALVYFYDSGTTTPANVYSDSTLSTPRTNPVVADSAGVLPIIYLAAKAYRVTVTTSDGTVIYPAQDNIYDLYQVSSSAPANDLEQTVTIEATPSYSFTFPPAAASGALQMDGSGNVTVVTDSQGVLYSDGTGNRSFTQAPTLTTPSMTTPVVSTKVDLTGGQIAFPATQVSSTNANTLDDYEEGVWTPTMIGDGGTTTGQSYQKQEAKYQKIGRWVYCTVNISLSAKGTGYSGTTVIAGLPFAPDSSADSACAFGDFDSTATAQVWIAGIIFQGNVYVYTRSRAAASVNMSFMDATEITDTTACGGFFHYLAAA